MTKTSLNRIGQCAWPGHDPLYLAYHDEEWGVPEYNDRELFEKLVLDGFQAGLSWITILKKRDAFRTAFARFDPERIANFTDNDIKSLMENPGIVRNRAKITATIGNARCYLEIQSSSPGFSSYLWDFSDGQPIQNDIKSMGELPTKTELSKALSKDLKKRGFLFVGPTIIYAFMQAIGMVNDHLITCFRHGECANMSHAKRQSGK